MTTPPAAVSVAQLTVHYHGGPRAAVSDVSFTLEAGEGLLLTGPPHAGKTSVLRAVAGLVSAGGSLSLFGRPADAPRAQPIGYGPPERDFAPHLTARETVDTVARIRRVADRAAACERALDRAGLAYVADRRTRRLDLEGLRRLSLAIAIVGDPAVLVLDDPWPAPETFAEIRTARARGAAVLAGARHPAGLAPALGRRMQLRDGRPA